MAVLSGVTLSGISPGAKCPWIKMASRVGQGPKRGGQGPKRVTDGYSPPGTEQQQHRRDGAVAGW